MVPSLSRAFLLCPRGTSSWLEATSKSMFDTVKTPGHISLRDGENPDVGVMLKTLEQTSSCPGTPQGSGPEWLGLCHRLRIGGRSPVPPAAPNKLPAQTTPCHLSASWSSAKRSPQKSPLAPRPANISLTRELPLLPAFPLPSLPPLSPSFSLLEFHLTRPPFPPSVLPSPEDALSDHASRGQALQPHNVGLGWS